MKLFNDYNSYLKTRFGRKVYRIGVDAGLSCPNRDGAKGTGGCAYCNDAASRSSYADPNESVGDQIARRIEYLKNSRPGAKFIAYFQASSNTYAPVDKLKKLYDQVLPFDDVVGIFIGTRPDVVDAEKLRLISSYKDRYDVWMEYGLQSAHDKTLNRINRRHTFADFTEALKLTRKAGIHTCVHVILGLPGETRSEMIETAISLTREKVDGVKIHLLHILKGSRFEELYRKGEVALLEQDEYVDLVCDFLEYLSPEIIIQRMTGEGAGESHIAPLWALDKLGTIERIGRRLKDRGTFQGFKSA